jgi:hypothetical protein
MGSKILRLNDQGEIVKYGGKYLGSGDSGWAIYETDKSDSGYVHRTVHSTGRRRNDFRIRDKDGWFEVVWSILYARESDNQLTENAEILVGQFAKLKDAEKRAIQVAVKMRSVRNAYNYSKVLAERQVRIDEVPLFTLTLDPQTKEYVEGEMEWDLDVPVLDLSGVQSKKQEKLDREENRKVRLAGGEDTRIMVKILMNVDLQNLEESIADYLQGEVDTIDGVGADGDSTYNVDEVQVKVESTGKIEATFYLERESGKFAGKDELADALMDQLGKNSTVEVPIEITN